MYVNQTWDQVQIKVPHWSSIAQPQGLLAVEIFLWIRNRTNTFNKAPTNQKKIKKLPGCAVIR